MDKRKIIHGLVVLVVAFIVRLIFLRMVSVVAPDETYYISLSQDLAQGKGYGIAHGAYEGQPLFPWLCALAMRVAKYPVTACQLLSVFLGVLTILPLHLCVRSFATHAEALWTDWIYALAPFTIQYSLWAMPHVLFNLCLVTALFFALKVQSSGRSRWAALTGVALAFAYWTRPEGFVWALVLGILGCLMPWLEAPRAAASRRFFLTLIMAAIFVVVSVPLWIAIRNATHAWQMAWTAGGGVSAIFMSRCGEPWGASSLLRSMTMTYLKNLSAAYNLLLRIIPLPLWFAIAFGVAGALQRKQTSLKALLLILFFACFPLFFYPLYLVEARYLYPGLMVLFVFAGISTASVQRYLAEGFPYPMKMASAKILCYAALLLIFLPGYRSLALGFGEEPMEQKRLGAWIQEHIHSPQVILGADRRSGFYAGPACKQFKNLQNIQLPAANAKAFESFLSANAVDLVVADTRYIPKFCPQFMFLLSEPVSPMLRPLITLTEGYEKIMLFQVQRSGNHSLPHSRE